jgi:hypothetical protein
MNQIVGTKTNGSKFLALILEPGNIHKLQQQQTISLRIEDLFPEGIPKRLELAILYSETPVVDARELAGMAEVVMDERTAQIKKTLPHCPECKTTIEQLVIMKHTESPVDTFFCASCGCV